MGHVELFPEARRLWVWTMNVPPTVVEGRRRILKTGFAAGLVALFMKVTGFPQFGVAHAQQNDCPYPFCPPNPCSYIGTWTECNCSPYCGNCNCTNDYISIIDCYCGDCGGIRSVIYSTCNDIARCGTCA